MDITVDSNNGLGELSKNLPKAIKRGLARATAAQELNIKHRTKRGKGLDGKFAPYSDGYAGFRQREGRQTSKVDLNFSGRMLGSIQWLVNRRTGFVYFSSGAEKKKAAWNQELRPWFGIRNDERRGIQRAFDKGFGRAL